MKSIFNLIYTIALAFFFPAVTCLAFGQYAPENNSPENMQNNPVNTQFVLKTDFNLLSGVVKDLGASYAIEVNQGRGTLYINKNNVLAVSPSMDVIYQERLKAMSSEDAGGYAALADWCIKYHLLDKAEWALAQARQRHSTLPMISVIQRRLTLAKNQRQRLESAQNVPAEPAVMPEISGNSGIVHVRETQVQQSALDQMARNMPGDTVRQFTMEVQPLLINSCSAASCHGEQASNNFRLLRSVDSRAVTLKNLYSVLRQVNRDAPEESALLTKAGEAHGNLELPVFSRGRNSGYAKLVGWTYRVTRPAKLYSVEQAALMDKAVGVTANPIPTVDDSSAAPLNQASFNQPNEAALNGEETANPAFNSDSNPAVEDDANFPPIRRRVAPGQSTENVKRGNPEPDNYQQLDPFDPELFNKIQDGSASESPLISGAQQALPNTNLQGGQNVSGSIRFTPNGAEQYSQPTDVQAPVQPQYTGVFDYPASPVTTYNPVPDNINTHGQYYAAPSGLPGPASVPTPAQQMLRQYEQNNAAPGKTPQTKPANSQKKPAQKSAPVQSDGYDALPRLDKIFGGV